MNKTKQTIKVFHPAKLTQALESENVTYIRLGTEMPTEGDGWNLESLEEAISFGSQTPAPHPPPRTNERLKVYVFV